MNVIKGKPDKYLSNKTESNMSPKRPEAAAESKISLHPIHRVNLLYFYSIAPPLSMRCGLFSESALFIFLLTAERKIIINCAYTHIAVCCPPCENCLERENRAVGLGSSWRQQEQ
ncbi:MAG: hypothetical protein D3914_10915 [Candidatus Electrothrix sp. LOE2]|nr:hypothetical protein [Candidatus Electrothrix sp. LOE2]